MPRNKTPEELFLEFVSMHTAVEDRRPRSANPLPHRIDAETGGYGKYRKHDFEKDCLGICVHHSAAPQKVGGRLDQHASVHLDRWESAGGIAYTMGILPDGKVVLCWDFDLRLYSQGWKDDKTNPETLGDENIKWKGVLVDGNFNGPHNPTSDEQPTAAQVHALEAVRAAFWVLFGMKEVTTHSEHGKPACPGERLEQWAMAHKNIINTKITIDSDKDLQFALNKLGFDCGTPDGVIGPKTLKAIKMFQVEHSLVADGIVGPNTKGAILRALQGIK